MVGSYTAARAAERGWDVLATYSKHEVAIPGCRMIKADILSPHDIQVIATEFAPDAIIHTAAEAKPDVCEQQKNHAFSLNVLGTFNVITAAEKTGAHLVHVSTDMVFDGKHNPYKIDASLCAANYYGLTKAAAEIAVQAASTTAAVVRTSSVYGPRRFPHLRSFSDTIISALSDGNPVHAFTDQYRAAIPTWNLADILLEIAERKLTGLFHGVCPEATTRYQFARKVADVFELDADLIQPVSSDTVASTTPRPAMLVLDTTSTSRALNTRMLSFEDGILELRERMQE